MQRAVERWRELLDARARQMDAAYAALGRTSADFWDRRAGGFYHGTKDRTHSDPLFLKLRQIVTPQTTILDVGAGTGRFSLGLAPYVGHVTAVEPNAAMLSYLRSDADERSLTNISYVPTTWQDASQDLQADIVICSHVLYAIGDIEPFLAKLHSAAHQSCYIYMRATHFDALSAHLWRHFHGDERCLLPGYIHALDVMYDIGMYADVEVVTMPQTLRYPTLEIAVEEMLEQLILPDNVQTRDELRKLLEAWLVVREDMFTPPDATLVTAILRLTSAA